MSQLYKEYADVAQLVEQRIENPCVTGSNPVFGTKQCPNDEIGIRASLKRKMLKVRVLLGVPKEVDKETC